MGDGARVRVRDEDGQGLSRCGHPHRRGVSVELAPSQNILEVFRNPNLVGEGQSVREHLSAQGLPFPLSVFGREGMLGEDTRCETRSPPTLTVTRFFRESEGGVH